MDADLGISSGAPSDQQRRRSLRLLTMSDGELSRLEVINRVLDGRLSQVAAGRLLGLTDRQVRRLVCRVVARGADGLVSRRRGRPSNNLLDGDLKDRVPAILRNQYADLGPTLAAENRRMPHGIYLARETGGGSGCRLDLDPRDARLARTTRNRSYVTSAGWAESASLATPVARSLLPSKPSYRTSRPMRGRLPI